MKPYYEGKGVALYHGDCLEILDKLEVDAIISDPPYGVSHNTAYSRFTGGNCETRKDYTPVLNDSLPFDPSPFLGKDIPVFLFGANNFSDKLPIGSWLVWDKRYNGKPLVMSDGEVGWMNKGHGVYILNHYWDGWNRESERGEERQHPTQKPVAVMKWVIEKVSKVGDVVLDPFMGSGTTGVACVETNRKFIGIELEEKYCEIAVNRIRNASRELVAAK